jgi:hypothetical protein
VTRSRLGLAIGLMLVLTTGLEAQTGPIRVEAGKTQVVVTVPKGDVKITQPPTRGTAAPTANPAVPGGTQISYTSQQTSTSVTDSFKYTVDAGAEQEVTLQVEPPVFDLDRATYEKIFKAIFLLFILALVLESGLALIFNWRPFVETFDARAVKPLVSLIFAYLFVSYFNLDLMTAIVAAASSQAPAPSLPGRFITALVLAGGSSGINNIMIALGFRQARPPATVTPKPPLNKAWIAFKLVRRQAVGQVKVFLGPTPAPGAALPLVGVIHGASRPGVRFFFRDRGRFPTVAGWEVTPGLPLSYELVGASNDPSVPVVKHRRDDVVIAAGAIIDLEVEL